MKQVGLSLIVLLFSFAAAQEGSEPSTLDIQDFDASTATVVDAIQAMPNLGSLLTAIETAQLISVLEGGGPFTIFAPTNDAFARLQEEELNALFSNPEALADLLQFHVW